MIVISRITEESIASDTEVGPHGERIFRVQGDSRTGVGLRRLIELVAFPIRANRMALSLNVRPDVVLADPPPTVALALLSLARRLKSRSVYYFADSWAELLRSSKSLIRRGLSIPVGLVEHHVLRRSDLVIAVTAGREALALRSGAQVVLSENGVDGAIFTANPAPSEAFNPPTTRPYFLYAGNFGEAHGADIFAHAATDLWDSGESDFAVIYMGYGSTRSSIDAIASRWPDRMFVLPPADPAVAASAFRQCRAGLASVKPDKNLHHAISVKALASIMCGAPLVYSGIDDFAQIVESREYGLAAGILSADVKDAFKHYLLHPWGTEDRAALASRSARYYDNRNAAEDLAELIQQLRRS